MNYEGVGKPLFRIIKNDKPTKDDKIVSVSDDESKIKNSFRMLKAEKNEAFQHIPDKNTERSVMYVSGQSGSGKSYWTSKYLNEYLKTFKKRDIYIFSCVSEDDSFDKIKYKNKYRIDIYSEEFLNEEIMLNDFKDSLVIFDDVDSIGKKVLKKKIYDIMNNILTMGRHYNISCIYTSHCITNAHETKVILNEAHSITIFPKTAQARSTKYFLDIYMGFDKAQIKRIKNATGRAVTLLKTYPMVILSQNEAYITNDPDID